MRPENYLVVEVEEKAQPVRRGGVCAESRHFIQQHVDQLFFNLKAPTESPQKGNRYVNARIQTATIIITIIIAIIVIVIIVVVNNAVLF